MTEASAEILAPVQRIAPDAIRLERTLDAPIDKVWRYLTEADLRRDWFMGGTDATAGGEFDLKVDHDNLSDDKHVPYPESYAEFKGTVWSEKVIRFEPPRLLETTFQGGKNGTVDLRAQRAGRQDAAGADPRAGSPAAPARRISAAAGIRTSPSSRSGWRDAASPISGRFTRNRARRSPRRSASEPRAEHSPLMSDGC